MLQKKPKQQFTWQPKHDNSVECVFRMTYSVQHLCQHLHQQRLRQWQLHSYYTTRGKKSVPKWDVSFDNSELHQAYGHVTLTMSTWPKYGHRLLVGCRLPRLCSYSWPPYVCRLIPWVVLFFDGFLCLRSWHWTNRWHDFLLPHNPLWLTFGVCCQIFPICLHQCSVADGFHFLLLLSITPVCFFDVCTATVVARDLVHSLTCLANCTLSLGWNRRFLSVL